VPVGVDEVTAGPERMVASMTTMVPLTAITARLAGGSDGVPGVIDSAR
jgi:hypothetical protein